MKKNYMQTEINLLLELFLSKKYILLLAALLLLASASSSAQTSGPNNPSNGTFVAGANVDWTTPGNITNTADANYTTAVFAVAANTDNLIGSNYGFSIPNNAIINGIVLTVNRRTSATNAGRITKDNFVSLVKNGVITGNNKAVTTAYGTIFSVATYGSSTDTWGTTWTPADINATNFGAVISVNANNSLTATVDYLKITIHYTTIGFFSSSACEGSNASIIITGNYIAGTNAVSFDGTSATFVQNSNTQVTATLPTGATSGTISLTTPQGTATSSTSFTINPLPTVNAITGTTILCAGGTATLSNTTSGGSWSSASPSIATINGFGNVSGLTNGNAMITYSFTDGNGCSNSATTTVTVNASPIITAPSSICIGSTIQLSPSTGGNWASNDTSIATIDNSGLVTAINYGNVTFTFTDDTTTCSNTTNSIVVPQSMSITTQPVVSQTICENNLVTLSLTAAGDNLSYQWFKGATALVNGGNISGVTTPIVTFNLITPADSAVDYHCIVSNGCNSDLATDYATVTVNEQSVGGTASISLPNVTPVVRTTTVCHFGSGNVYLSGHIGNIIRWESTTNGGVTWTPITNTTTTLTYSNITQTTFYRAVVQNGITCNLAYSYVVLVDVIPNIRPTPVTATPQTICVGGSSVLYSESGFATSSYIAEGGTFSNANPDNWLVDGCGNCLNAGGSNTTEGPFRLSATNGGTYSGINYTSMGKFAIANGSYNSIMQTPIFNTYGLTTAELSFNHAFNLQAGASVSVELSLDGGTTYTVVLASFTGPSIRSPYNAFPNQSIDLSNYIGQPNLRVRFVYNGTVNSSWAIDNILIPESPANLTTQWIDSITGEVISTTATATVSPTTTTTYAVTSYLNGCTSYGPEGTTYITVNVNERPTANIGPSQTICLGNPATFSVALTGSAPWSITYSNGSTTTTVNNINTNPYVFNVNGITTNRTFTITALSDSKCTANSTNITGAAVVTVLNGTPGLWTGMISNDWFDCKNWAGGMPSATINAQIPNGVVRMPIIDPSSSSFAALYGNIARAQDVIIANNASLTMATNSDLYVSRDWKNSGTFLPGAGTVTFNSSTANQIQTINLGIKTNETFYNLTLNNSNTARGISVVNGFELTVENNLSLLSGDLRLTGEAQLVQNGTTANPSNGTGRILKDQQGTQSSYHYNYWSSPVTNNGSNYTISSVLRDGSDSASNPFNPSLLSFGADLNFADGALTFPAKLSTGWMYKFTSLSSSYAGWQHIGENGTVNPAEGFTMKGPTGTGSAFVEQNYVFTGKPNNGTIGLNISLNQSYLVGNPYPSALDADEFIKDNIKDGDGRAASNIFNGALYFWDHFGGQTHILGQYVGGYATYTLMGGVVALSNDPLTANNGSSGTKTPKRHIPVAQGFFIGTGPSTDLGSNNPNLSTPVTGGTITFKNSQRAFKVESVANSVFFRNQNDSQNVDSVNDERQKIRLVFESPNQVYRQILVGVDQNATNSFDIGYDAPLIEAHSDDLYWNISEGKYTIQAVSNFNTDQIIPIGLKTSIEGLSTIKIAGLENIAESTEIYIHDNVTGIDHNIRNSDFVIALPIGEYNNQFSLRFSGQALSINNPAEVNPIIYFTNNDSSLNIKNPNLNLNLKSVSLFNLLGQLISTYSIENSDQQNIRIPILNIANGTYIVKMATDSNKKFSQKIIKN
ncbi:T9SS type A sorting domain-containing protein [Flavobacterium sp. J49]|uniref:Ig-like domain-containing protein n=1 Tax=Flavobacterium sp. J49 TaxID=2718534 RepID=UPI0015944A04|nr:Ig-like domain-containing protein [Flavobacterium sp. J49]MBF6640378.1 T9SS type A sorting domain-containing protein [Flavobacterium sp. J49]NIC01623.1 T9SS type A sorting domain-containing protein [Flavobacterium sp. J49]